MLTTSCSQLLLHLPWRAKLFQNPPPAHHVGIDGGTPASSISAAAVSQKSLRLSTFWSHPTFLIPENRGFHPELLSAVHFVSSAPSIPVPHGQSAPSPCPPVLVPVTACFLSHFSVSPRPVTHAPPPTGPREARHPHSCEHWTKKGTTHASPRPHYQTAMSWISSHLILALLQATVPRLIPWLLAPELDNHTP